MALLGIVGALAFQRHQGISEMLTFGAPDELAQMVRFMGVADILLLPSSWIGRGLKALEVGDWKEAGFWLLCLWSTCAMGLVVCDWLAGPFYYRGWCSARSTGARRRRGSRGFYGWFERLLAWIPAPTRALVVKDLAVFWRDPAQWGQLMVLFGLLFIYMVNLRSASGLGRYEQILTQFWQSLISMFNIGATAFVLSILTTRFVYPMLSLEGKQQWVIGLAPLNRSRLVWVKFWVSCLCASVIAAPLALLSCWMLRTDAFITLLALATIGALALGLSSLAVGLGAMMPNFNDDNPSRIASGLGGTINAVLSLLYIGLTLMLEAPWVHFYLKGGLSEQGWDRALILITIPAWVLLHTLMIVVPLKIGLARWRRMEF
jgi:ABC-2 type transport system permease protein